MALNGSQSKLETAALLESHSPGANSLAAWHSQDVVGYQDISRLGPSRVASSRSRSSIINDGGDAEQLAVTATPTRRRSFTDPQRPIEFTNEILRSLDVSYTGGGTPSDDRRHPNTLDSELASQGEDHLQDHDDGRHAGPPLTAKDNLEHDLRAAFIDLKGEGKFLPNDELDKIITASRVKRELQKHSISIESTLDDYTIKILGITKSPRLTSRRRIFAILVLLQKVPAVLDFISHGIYDNDLPFVITKGSGPAYYQMSRTKRDGTTEAIAFCHDPIQWPPHALDGFQGYQQLLLAPYFQLSTKSKPTVLHYNLESNRILPFTEVDKDGISARRGGFGDVWRIKIHHAHHNSSEYSAHNSNSASYAVKRLRHSDKDAFEAEVSTLKRLGDQDHLHLIKLLVTFSHRNKFYLLFPWADGGNLRDLWETGYPNPKSPPRDEALAQWLSRQILGIAEGLRMIHNSEIKSFNGISLNAPDVNRKYGRHGDLKPENILWFKTYPSDEKAHFMGLLKISDFGMATFHGSQTRSRLETESLGRSPTYRAPEYDISMHVSQKYDIWTLGCVLIEFVTWYLQGWAGVDRFSKSRAKDDSKKIKQDVFFDLELSWRNGQSRVCATMKRAVVKHLDNLREHPDCADYILELLDFIETDLLRMEPDNRAKLDDIVRKAKIFHERCETDMRYCTDRLKQVTERVRTDLSSILSLSPEMVERYRQTHSDWEEDNEPESMPTVEAEHIPTTRDSSISEPQQPPPEITVNGSKQRDYQPQQSGFSTQLLQAEMVNEENGTPPGFQCEPGEQPVVDNSHNDSTNSAEHNASTGQWKNFWVFLWSFFCVIPSSRN